MCCFGSCSLIQAFTGPRCKEFLHISLRAAVGPGCTPERELQLAPGNGEEASFRKLVSRISSDARAESLVSRTPRPSSGWEERRHGLGASLPGSRSTQIPPHLGFMRNETGWAKGPMFLSSRGCVSFVTVTALRGCKKLPLKTFFSGGRRGGGSVALLGMVSEEHPVRFPLRQEMLLRHLLQVLLSRGRVRASVDIRAEAAEAGSGGVSITRRYLHPRDGEAPSPETLEVEPPPAARQTGRQTGPGPGRLLPLLGSLGGFMDHVLQSLSR